MKFKSNLKIQPDLMTAWSDCPSEGCPMNKPMWIPGLTNLLFPITYATQLKKGRNCWTLDIGLILYNYLSYIYLMKIVKFLTEESNGIKIILNIEGSLERNAQITKNCM